MINNSRSRKLSLNDINRETDAHCVPSETSDEGVEMPTSPLSSDQDLIQLHSTEESSQHFRISKERRVLEMPPSESVEYKDSGKESARSAITQATDKSTTSKDAEFPNPDAKITIKTSSSVVDDDMFGISFDDETILAQENNENYDAKTYEVDYIDDIDHENYDAQIYDDDYLDDIDDVVDSTYYDDEKSESSSSEFDSILAESLLAKQTELHREMFSHPLLSRHASMSEPSSTYREKSSMGSAKSVGLQKEVIVSNLPQNETVLMEAIRITGVEGRTAEVINGLYYCDKRIVNYLYGGENGSNMQPSTELYYKLYGSRNSSTDKEKDYADSAESRIWLEYVHELERWQFKPSNGLGQDLCWAFIESKDGTLFHNNRSRSIEVWTGKGPGAWWTAMPKAQILKRIRNGVHGISIVGFTGQLANRVNGIYEEVRNFNPLTINEEFEAIPSYRKVDKQEVWLLYHYTHKAWVIQSGDDVGTKKCWAYTDKASVNVDLSKFHPYELKEEWIGKDDFQKQTVQIVKL